MNKSTGCLTADELGRVIRGSGDHPAAWTQHLDQCEDCQAKLEALAVGGTNLSQVVEGLNLGEPLATSAYWPAIRSVEALGAAAGGTTTRNRSRSSTDFLLPPADPAYVGRLAYFDVMRVIGHGGMGIVLEAFDSRLRRNVALKVLDPDLANDQMARQRFCREARAAASISHENVVAVHQVEHADESGLPYLVMQLVAGETLEQRLLRERRLPLKEVVRIALQAAQGLAAAHAQGLTHRDVKPGNILLESPGDRVKLTDFGLARVTEDAKITSTGLVAGTPLYMAPEQALGLETDARSDLFSLGAILYEMCTGQPPFQGNSVLTILKQITESKHRPVRELNPEVPEWLAEMIDELLAKKPEDRYQTAADLAEVLEYVWTQMKSSTAELPAVCQEELKRRSIRHRLIIGGIGAGLLVMGVLAGMFLPRGNHDGRAAPATFAPANFATATDVPAAVAPASSAEPLAVLAANAGTVWSVAFDPQSNLVAMGVEDGLVRIWNLPQQSVESTVEAHRGIVWSLKFSDDGQFFATSGYDGLLKIFDRSSLEPLRVFEHPRGVRGLAINGSRLFTGDAGGGVYVWASDSSSGVPLLSAQQPGVVYAVAISPDGKTLASAGTDKTIHLWNAETLKPRLKLDGHAGPVNSLSFNARGNRLASAGWDGQVRLWDVAAGKLERQWNGHRGDIWAIAYSPDGTKLATGGTDGAVKIWDGESGGLLATYLGHNNAVDALAFSHDGSLLGSGGRDGAVRVWRIE
jgi:WD40 repeat protein